MPDILLPVLCGMLTLGLIVGNQRINVGFALALGYALGMGILGQLMLLMGWQEISIDKGTVSLALFIYLSVISLLFLLRLYFFSSDIPPKSPTIEPSLTWMRKAVFVIMLAYISYQMAYIFWNAWYLPVYQADAFSLHAYKAKIFFHTHHLKQPSELYLAGKYLSYPLQIPLVVTWVALNIGQWHEGWAQMTIALNCLVFIVIVYHGVKLWTDRLTALLTVTLILSSFFFVLHASMVYGDFTVMSYTILALLLMAWGVHSRAISFIILGGLMSAFGASVKLEGIEYFVLELIVLCRFIFAKEFFDPRFALKSFGGYVLPFILVEANFLFFKAHYGITELSNQEHQFVFFQQGLLAYIFTIAMALVDNFFLSGNWSILWFFLIVMVLANGGYQKSFAIQFFSFALGIFFVCFGVTVPFTELFVYYTDRSSMDTLARVLLHFYPLCPILIGLLTFNFLKNRRPHFASHPVELL